VEPGPHLLSFDRPTCTLDQAVETTRSAHLWHARTLHDAEEIADRLIEIVAFRASRLWLDHHGTPGAPGMFQAPPQFETRPHAAMLLVPVLGYSNFTPGYAVGEPDITTHRGFFEEASCDNLLGSMAMGELFRRLMCARFGPPVGTSAINLVASNWPEPSLWRGADAVLQEMMTEGHRTRREARLLELATDLATSTPWQRRL
jgi:hypothetical protein